MCACVHSQRFCRLQADLLCLWVVRVLVERKNRPGLLKGNGALEWILKTDHPKQVRRAYRINLIDAIATR
jgi:hypothetical protein